MFDLPKIFKEVILENTQVNQWKEFCFNTGGNTLQDIKVVPYSGGYVFNKVDNRFIYWRTNYDILEIIEYSLNVNLIGNQIRYKFQNSPILEGLTVHERGDTVVILVPTVSSVHRLTFRHPFSEKSNDGFASIFSDVTAESISSPTTYHLLNTVPHIPHTGASILSDSNDAIFCLALNNSSVLVINLNHLTGMTVTHELKADGISRKSFLYGLNVFRSKTNNENNTISMALERYDRKIFLFALNYGGQLRVWCCSKFNCLGEYNILGSNQLSLGAQNHVLRTKLNGRQLTLAAHVSLTKCSQIIVLCPRINDTIVVFDNEPFTYALPACVDLIDMTISCDSEVIWCIWRSQENGDITISALNVSSGKWSLCVKEDRNITIDSDYRLGVTAREHYLNLIFEPGRFSLMDISKVLSISKGTPQLEYAVNKSELRSKVCISMENEIQTEAWEYELSDEDFVDISERCWNKFYMNCVQYQDTGRLPNSLFWLQSASLLAVISKNNISFFRPIEILEEALLRPEYCTEIQSYQHLLHVLGNINLNTEQKIKFNQALRGFSLIEEVISELACEFKLENKVKSEIDKLMKYQNLQTSLRNLSDLLFMPETFEIPGDFYDSFRSNLGFQIVFATAKQIIKTRLDACRNLALLLQMLDSCELKKEFLAETLNLCQSYFVLHWCCETVVQDNPQLISLMQLILSQPEMITQPLLLDTVWSLMQYLWPLTNSVNLAKYLLSIKQNVLLMSYARLVPHKSFKFNLKNEESCAKIQFVNFCKIMIVQNYLEMNEPYKAYDLIIDSAESPEAFLKMIKLFEHASQSDIVIELAKLAIEKAEKINHSDLPTLYSILFLHHLKLGHYDKAFVSLDKNPDKSRRIDCLRELVVTLMNAKKIDKLLSLPYSDLLSQLEDIMIKRARSLEADKAHMYYNFLYALYMKYDNYRNAANVMFEQGFRSYSSKQQMVSYAMCINCLSLINPQNAWVLKPRLVSQIDGNNDEEDTLEIYELKNLIQEFELASAKSKLSNCPVGESLVHSKIIANLRNSERLSKYLNNTSAQEVVLKLTTTGRYRLALKLSYLYKLPLEPPLEALAIACTRITNEQDPWNWLIENEVSDFIIGDENAIIVAWRLLEALLMQYEDEKLTTLHKAIACKILSMGVVLPYWLEVSYKKRNSSELMRLYLIYGNLNEAATLCSEYIAACLGKGKEIFGLEYSLNINSPPMYLPINTIDMLLLELKEAQMNDLYVEVKSSLEVYLDTAQRITDDMIRYKRHEKRIL